MKGCNKNKKGMNRIKNKVKLGEPKKSDKSAEEPILDSLQKKILTYINISSEHQ